MPCFIRHIPSNRHGWITGTLDARKDKDIYKVYAHFGPYDEGRTFWDQWRNATESDRIVNLDDCEIISTETAILVGIYVNSSGELTFR